MSGPEMTFSTAEFAALVGISKRHVGRLVDAGIIDRLARGKFAASEVPKYCAWLRDENRHRASDYGTERARLTAVKADLATLELRHREGDLVDISAVSEAVVDLVTTTRSRLLVLPTRLAPRVASESDPAVCEGLLRKDLYAALRELSEADPQELAKQGVAA